MNLRHCSLQLYGTSPSWKLNLNVSDCQHVYYLSLEAFQFFFYLLVLVLYCRSHIFHPLLWGSKVSKVSMTSCSCWPHCSIPSDGDLIYHTLQPPKSTSHTLYYVSQSQNTLGKCISDMKGFNSHVKEIHKYNNVLLYP